MRIVVMGGRGFVGSALVRLAKKQGHVVLAITRDNYARHRGTSCDWFINANGNSRKYLADQDPAAEFEASVVSVQRSLLDFSFKKYVYLSSIDVYPRVDRPRFNGENAEIQPERLSRYGLHKWLAEQVVRRYAGHWLIVRLGGMVGEGLWKNPIFDMLHGTPLRVHVNSSYQYLATDDVARIVFRLAQRQRANDLFNVCGHGCLSLREVASWIPGYQESYAVANPRREHYEIRLTKLRRWTNVPKTCDVVRAFIRRQLA